MLFYSLALLVLTQNPVTGALPNSPHLAAGAPGYNKPHMYLLLRKGYASLVDDRTKDPAWVEYRLTKSDLTDPQGARLNNFRSDPDLPAIAQAQLADYKNIKAQGIDKGHMAPANDMEKEVPDASDPDLRQHECLYLSNICPQQGYFNEHLWAKLEADCQGFVKKYGTVIIITGPEFATNPKTIGPGKVAVPRAFFKICVVASGTHKGMWTAVEIANKKPAAGATPGQFVTTISDIESHTGYKFFTGWPGEQELEDGTNAQLPLK